MSPASSAASASDAAPPPLPHVVEDCGGLVKLLSDGTVIRSPSSATSNTNDDDDPAVEWKDVVFDADHDLCLRIYRPASRLSSDPEKYPVLYFIHGGGFCLGSRTMPTSHRVCCRFSAELRTVVVSPDYRLAPEHRLPAAIDDGVSSLLWLKKQASQLDENSTDPWLRESADFNCVFVSGESAGGTIVHHLAVRFSGAAATELSPVRVKGYLLIMPYFGGKNRTRSEASCPKDVVLNLDLSDSFWRLSLPAGASIDDTVANPLGPAAAAELEKAELAPLLVVVGEKDLLRDREVEYAERLKAWGKVVELVEMEGKEHGYLSFNACSGGAVEVFRLIGDFMEKWH